MRAGVALLAALLAGCSPDRDPVAVQQTLAARAQAVAARAAVADSAAARGTPSDAPIALWYLPPRYNEISGLALTPDGRLLAQGDEAAEIWEIDYRRGVVTRSFSFGEPAESGDFEAIAVARGRIYLMDSKARIYEGSEGRDGDHVHFNVYDTGLADECEFEGLAFEPATSSLVLACKHAHRKRNEDALVLFRWPLPGTSDSARSEPRIVVPVERFQPFGVTWKTFEASDLTWDARRDRFVVLSSLEHGIAEVSPSGEVLAAAELPKGHRQPEGLAITADGRMIIADEAAGARAAITVYPAAP